MYTLAIDQSTSATKLMLFDESERLCHRVTLEHTQYYPQPGWVEHDAEEIMQNIFRGAAQLLRESGVSEKEVQSVALTNQRETVVVWEASSGRPIYRAVVWQCQRGARICAELRELGCTGMVQSKTGLLIDPYFSASGVKWILDNVAGAREKAEAGLLRMGTMDAWMIWQLTGGRVHACDRTNASRTMLYNIHTLDWDDELLALMGIPRSMMPEVRCCDEVYGKTTFNGLFSHELPIAGVLGDSHGALVGQVCFSEGLGKATYGTGSSVMVNIGREVRQAPPGLVTSVGFAAQGQTWYAFEGNIHCTGATIKWMVDDLELIASSAESEALAVSVPDNGGVFFVPAFAGLGAPWWQSDARAVICGMSRGTRKAHVVRAALEAIAYQVRDLADLMTRQAGISLKELRVDGGPAKNRFLMQFQADMLNAAVNVSPIAEASALGAVLMNSLAMKRRSSLEEISALRRSSEIISPKMSEEERNKLYAAWLKAVRGTIDLSRELA
ncbi:MAG: glycerol kinase GlpK [Bacteroidales bacterium]|nr:glycerol kinase GlpK [Bacteroidales bacterium]